MPPADTVLEGAVREVTAGEVAFFQEHGWAFLPGFVESELAARLLTRARVVMGEEAGDHVHRANVDLPASGNNEYGYLSKDDELFRALATARGLGRNGARLLGRDSAMRVIDDRLKVKRPAALDGKPTRFHQDLFNPIDRNSLSFWIALDEITPEQGPMVFFSGSQKLGRLGRWDVPLDEVYDRAPLLRNHVLSEPLHFRPGDATIHADGVVHGAPENTTDRPRWAYLVHLTPADTLYTGAPSAIVCPPELGPEPFAPLDHPKFPITYDPRG